MLAACHGRETDEVIAGLRADNDRLRGEIAALRVENAVQLDDREPHWPVTASLKWAGAAAMCARCIAGSAPTARP